MKKLDFWRSDWFLGIVVALVVLVLSGRDLIQSLERKAYDLGVQATTRVPSERVAVIAIDDASIANIGRWPWSREVHARMVDVLAGAKAKVIINSTFFFEPQLDAGLAYINKLLELHGNIPQGPTVTPGLAEPLLIRHYDRYFPSLALMAAAKSLNLQLADLKPQLGEAVLLGRLTIPGSATWRAA